MTPMHIQMACKFCHKPLKFKWNHELTEIIDLYECRDCQRPGHTTVHKQQYRKGEAVLLQEGIQLDDWYVLRRYNPNYSIIYSEVIGVFSASADCEPLAVKREVCRIERIFELTWNDIEAAKRKLAVYTTFS